MNEIIAEELTFERATLDRLEELLPNVRRSKVPGASHIMHEDNPELVNQAIASFVDR